MAPENPRKSNSLAKKLKSLGVMVGASDLAPASTARSYDIHKVLEGEYRATPSGETFVFEKIFDREYRHGRAPIRPETRFDVLAAWAQDPRLLKIPLEEYAFLDTETSGLAGGTGTYAFLIGVGRFVSDTSDTKKKVFRLEQFFMRDPAEEAALLEGLAGSLAPCQALVTFNGKAFDAPLLTTRYSLQNIPNPFMGFTHLDLLPLARRLWRDRLPSRALKYLEENILQAPRTLEEVPGYEIPYLYFDYLRSGDARPLKGVFYHNAMDVVAMAGLLSHVAKILDDPFSEQVEHGLDVIALAKLFEDLGRWDTAARLFERGLEMNSSSVSGHGLPEADFWMAVRRLSHLQKRRGDLDTALRLWERAAAEGHVFAHVELAKYHEHSRRDYVEALKWTTSAIELVGTLDIPRYEYRHWMDELEHRLERLVKKNND